SALGDAAAGSTAGGRTRASEWVLDLLDRQGVLVLKPTYGYGGDGVFVCRRRSGGDYSVNGESRPRSDVATLVDDLRDYLVWEFVEQASYAERIFPGSVNTLRVLTLWDYEAGEPFVAGAVHRFGSRRSAPVDNWSLGGLSAEIRDDGTLSEAARWGSAAGRVDWHAAHPDTEARIEGESVPNWNAVRDRVLEMAATFPYLPRIGWDIVLTPDGRSVVLEINTHPGVETLQVHRPLLADHRTRRFYEYHGYA
ncbi:sugar-transfer associated ATP-grasp domain-containing protein, partial [Halobium palmae]